MNAKRLFIPVLVSLIAAAGTYAQTSVINEMNINTDVEIYEGKSFYTADIDSITFLKGRWVYGNPNELYNMIKIYGNGSNRRTPSFPVSEIKGIEFTFRDARKLYAPKFVSGNILDESKGNAVHITWENVPDATGYELKYCTGYHPVDFFTYGDFELWMNGEHPEYGDNIELPADGGIIKLAADINEITLKDLNYSTSYTFAVRAISAEGDNYNSDWSIRWGIPRDINFTISTALRYTVPQLIKKISRTEEIVRVGFDLDSNAHKAEDYNDNFANNFEIVNNKFVADIIQVKGINGAVVPEKWKFYKLTSEDIANGYVDIDGLEGNGAQYTCALVNSNIESIPDRKYNTITIAKKEPFGEPVVIPHTANPETGAYNACCLDAYIENYMSHPGYDEGTFYLEGDKAYYISVNLALTKGITLETNPADVAAGKRATVYLGDLSGNSRVCNFILGESASMGNDSELKILTPITIRNIDFDCPEARNYGDGVVNGTGATGNYFINTISTHQPFIIEALNIEGCTFQRIIRGFVRLQGNTKGEIKKVNCDGNIFYNCGYYAANGTGYGYFHQPGDANTNIYSDFRFVNNTIYDSPNNQFMTDNNRNIAWNDDTKWNITIENNTFINFSTCAAGRLLLSMRYVPNGSHFSIQRNLFALTKNDADARDLYNSGVDIRNGNFTFEVKDNYSVGYLESHMKDDGIFTSGAFSATKNSFGAFTGGNMGSAEDLIVKVGTTPLKATDLFTNPNPPYNQVSGVYSGNDHKAPENIMEALKYKQTPEVLNHEIFTKNIGDQRWKTYRKELEEPIIIKHVADPSTADYNACRIDTIIDDYMSNSTYDDIVFYLEGGKAYYFAVNPSIYKGITLETNPDDVAVGKRAIIYMGGIGDVPVVGQFVLGNSTDNRYEKYISQVTIRNIDFDCPKAMNYGEGVETGKGAIGNYFFNCLSSHDPFIIGSLNIEKCTFQRFIRGFIRIQGFAKCEIRKVNCDGNIFYNCGYYAANGTGYGYFHQPGDANSNIYSDFRFVNNTIYDSPNNQLITDNNRNVAWSESTKWNITIENNTFVNFSTRTSSRWLISMRYVPNGSHFSIQRNLFALTKNNDDARDLYNSGVDIRNGNFTFEVKDNYSVGCLESHMKDDGIFTSGAFSATKNSFGAFTGGNMGSAEDLIVKVGTTPLKATDLFTNPNPPYNQVSGVYSGNDHKAPENIMEALKYKQTPEVLNHEIFTKNIGDQRWK